MDVWGLYTPSLRVQTAPVGRCLSESFFKCMKLLLNPVNFHLLSVHHKVNEFIKLHDTVLIPQIVWKKTVGSESSKGQPLSPWFYSTEKSPRHYIFEGFLDLSEGFPPLKTKKWRPIVPKYTSTYGGFTTEQNQTQISRSKMSLFTRDPRYQGFEYMSQEKFSNFWPGRFFIHSVS